MNVWTALPRLLVSSRCPHNVRVLVEESLSSSIRRYSANTPVTAKTKPPDLSVSHFTDLVKRALAQADSKAHTKHSPPRLRTMSNAEDIISPLKKKKTATRRRKIRPKEKKAASKNNTNSTKSKKQKTREPTAEAIPKQGLRDASEQLTLAPPPSQDLESSLSGFPTENWVREPWENQQNDDRPEDIDRSYPPHILEHRTISEGTLYPSMTNSLVDVPTVVEHLPVAKLCHGLERVLFKYVIHL